MRLYNNSSCTITGSPKNGPSWSPPRSYLPRQLGRGSSVASSQLSPTIYEYGPRVSRCATSHCSSETSSTVDVRAKIGFFSGVNNFRFDLDDEHVKVHSHTIDDVSNITSSTLSTEAPHYLRKGKKQHFDYQSPSKNLCSRGTLPIPLASLPASENEVNEFEILSMRTPPRKKRSEPKIREVQKNVSKRVRGASPRPLSPSDEMNLVSPDRQGPHAHWQEFANHSFNPFRSGHLGGDRRPTKESKTTGNIRSVPVVNPVLRMSPVRGESKLPGSPDNGRKIGMQEIDLRRYSRMLARGLPLAEVVGCMCREGLRDDIVELVSVSWSCGLSAAGHKVL